MTLEEIKVAIRGRIPFVIKMTGGEKYTVTDPYQIALGKTFVMVVDQKSLPHLLPLRRMTGLSYLEASKS